MKKLKAVPRIESAGIFEIIPESGSYIGCLAIVLNPEYASVLAAAPEMYEVLKECMSLFALGASAVSKKGANFEVKRARARAIERKIINAIAKAERKAGTT